MHWLFLGLAISCEVFGSTMLKLSHGFSKPLPSAGVVFGFGLAFYFLSLTLKTVPLGTAYAIWAGVGLVLTAGVSVVFFGQKADLPGIAAIALILAGVVVMNLFSQMGGH
ncbi:QacE family quaternary ammonium compound efflux SMR transporter [Neisseria weixii]|uniref:QacE family quaternary ammonium compound efflux SMR transporter n=1 Tax=Neisseria weixii TaxID=1853276 RepID=A0A3N4MIU6_9NEIS|nr:multidrug efflux SMR transporter [Neisseria weixii]RPD83572.1 QacE family quaternary ammonium compound efflux SMR transporter [Neisseria weixii]RPD84207.1 QacE family quaternary ammonium compound efflux SMR transporter [Neisseria weixii]